MLGAAEDNPPSRDAVYDNAVAFVIGCLLLSSNGCMGVARTLCELCRPSLAQATVDKLKCRTILCKTRMCCKETFARVFLGLLAILASSKCVTSDHYVAATIWDPNTRD